MAHPASDAVARDRVDGTTTRPLIQQIRKVDAGAHRDLDGGGQAGVDLHQVGHARAVASELHLRVSLQVDFAYEPFRLAADVVRHGDTLAQHRLPTQRWSRSGCPLRESSMHPPVGVQKADRLPLPHQQLLPQRRTAEAGQLPDCLRCLNFTRNEPRTRPRPLRALPQPRLTRLDHRRQSDFLQRDGCVADGVDDGAAGRTQAEARGDLQGPLLTDGNR